MKGFQIFQRFLKVLWLRQKKYFLFFSFVTEAYPRKCTNIKISNQIRSLSQHHRYVRTNPATTSTTDQLGLLVTVTLAGLGMFLLVMAVSFLAAQVVTKQDVMGVSDLEDVLVEHGMDQEDVLASEGGMDNDIKDSTKDIFIIDSEAKDLRSEWENCEKIRYSLEAEGQDDQEDQTLTLPDLMPWKRGGQERLIHLD